MRTPTSPDPAEARRRLLLHCVTLERDPDRSPGPGPLVHPDLDWSTLLRLALRHGLLPRVYSHLGPRFPDAVPPFAAQYLEQQFRLHRDRTRLLRHELLTLSEHFRIAGIRSIPFKGERLASSVWQFMELDFFVSRRDFRAARDVLTSQGYRPQIDWRSGREVRLLEATSSLRFASDGGRPLVILHWDVAPKSFAVDVGLPDAWRRVETVEILGTPVPMFAPDDLVLVLSALGATGLWERLILVGDFAESIATHPGIDWTGLLRRAQRLGVERILLLGSALAGSIGKVSLPGDARQRIAADPAVDRLVRQCHDIFFRDLRHRIDPKQRTAFHLQMRERRHDRHRYRWRRVVTPVETDLAPIQLPAPVASLFYGVRGARLFGAAVRVLATSLRHRRPPAFARFRTTPIWIVKRMLALAGVTANDVVYDLGCGDGRIVILAAKLYGARGTGIDIDPRHLERARRRANEEGVASLVSFAQQDAHRVDLTPATVVALYLQWTANLELRPMLQAGLGPGARVVSLNFDMGDWLPDDAEIVEEGPWGSNIVYLWRSPTNVADHAPAAGTTWEGTIR